MKTCYNHFRMLLQWVVHPAAGKVGRSVGVAKKKPVTVNVLHGFSPDRINMRDGKRATGYTRNPTAP